ncbi:MAG: hypothetical protein WDO14_16540 [Bacteroidota bacterium]
MKYFIAVIVALVLFSCGNSKLSGIVTRSTPLYKDEVGFDTIRILPTGAVLKFAGPALNAKFKVFVNEQEGYIDSEFFVPNGKPAVMKETFDTPEAVYLVQDDFVVYDSVAGDKAHIYSNNTHRRAWVKMTHLDLDTANATVAALIDAIEKDITNAEMRATLIKVAERHADHPRLQILKADLSELPDKEANDLYWKLNALIDKSNNRIIGSTRTVIGNGEGYVNDILKMPGDGDDAEYERPRYRYYYNYMGALPVFVKIMGKSAISWNAEVDSLKAYVLYRLDRSPENIKKLYDVFKPQLVESLSSGLLQDVRPEMTTLTGIYDHIVAMPNHRELVADISKNVAEWDVKNADNTDIYNKLIEQASIYEPIIEEEKFDTHNDPNSIWYHSFWVRRFAEGNEKVVYEILKELSEIQPDNQPEEGEGMSETEVITCTFNDYGMGDCPHIMFSCGDYGFADTSALSKDEQDLWSDLSTEQGDEILPNPEYVGKTFVMRVGSTTGEACNEGQGGRGIVPKILEFRLQE